jgi:hypothetical protein
MIGGLFKTTSTLALLAAAGIVIGGVAMTPTAARAADLGGDCCADLEERVAELEATTVRKGNRKVSLTIGSRDGYDDLLDGECSCGKAHGLVRSRLR